MVDLPETRIAPATAAIDGWLDAGVVRLDSGREAVLAFDRLGTARLSLTLDTKPRARDLDALERVADLLHHLDLEDLDPGGDYRRRHQAWFGLPAPLPASGHPVVIEVVTPDGTRLPRRLGVFGTEVRQAVLTDPADLAPGAAGTPAWQPPGEAGADGHTRPPAQAPTPGTAPATGAVPGQQPVEATPGQQASPQDLATSPVPPAPDHGTGTATPMDSRTADSPAVDSPTVDSPVVDPPTVDSPTAGPPTMGSSAAGSPATGSPAAGQGLPGAAMLVGGAVRPVRPVPPGVLGRAGVLADRFAAALGAAGEALARGTGLPAAVLCQRTAELTVALFVAVFVYHTWVNHARFGTYGFDLGIFGQGTWLLSRFTEPFVTVRGLHLFGDHASFILVLVAPLYRLWTDPRLLLLLQVLGLAMPALAVYRLAGRRLGNPAAGLAVALAYLAYPGLQWAITWQFHPETLAAGFLAGAVAAADARRGGWLAACVTLALLCKEDVGLVVAGLGALLWLTGQPTWGGRLVTAGLGWFLVSTFVLIPLFNGQGSLYLARNYGVQDTSLGSLLLAAPKLAATAAWFALSNDGLRYLMLVLAPLALLPLLAWRWLLPVAGPIGLSLAAVNGYQHEIRYHYLATSAMFLALGAAAGLAVLTARRRSLLAVGCVALLLCAGVMDYRYGPALWSKNPQLNQPPANAAARREALALIEPDAGVSAQFSFVPHLIHRTHVYEFPNPFTAVNWGIAGQAPGEADRRSVRYVITEAAPPNPTEAQQLAQLRQDPAWRAIFDRDGIVVLRRDGP